MNVYQYTALNNPQGSTNMVESYGIRAIRHPKHLAKQLALVVAKHRDSALGKLAEIHPDVPLFQKQIDDFKVKIKSESEKNNSSFSNFIDGQTIKSDIASLQDKVSTTPETGKSKTELLIIGGVIVIGLAIIFKK
jgi:LPXTG-motif cell wall-anchored protein